MKFWKELIWIATSVVLLICVIFLGIKLIQVENNQDASVNRLDEAKLEIYQAIADNYAELDASIDESIDELILYLDDTISVDIAAETALMSQQLKADLDEEIDGIILYLDGLAEEDKAAIIQYLDEVKAELLADIDANYTTINENLDARIATVNQYLQAEIDRLYNDFVENYELSKEYTDSRILYLEYLINLIVEINGLTLPAAYTPPDFEQFE